MRSDKLMPGIILVFIGVIFLLNNFNVINFHWSNLIHLWPIFLIMGGVNLVFANNRSAWATVLKIAVVIGGFSILIFGQFENHFAYPFYNWHNNYNHHNNNDSDDDNDDDDDDNDNRKGIVKVQGSATYSEPYNATAALAILNVNGGGTLYTIKDTTNQLFSATTKEFYNKFAYTHTMEGSTPVFGLRMAKNNNNNNFHWDSDNTNAAEMKLNARPEWEINVEAGATKLEFDLAKFKIRKLKISGGAASFEVKMGMPLASTNVEVSTGVSEVDIQVPEGAACQITSSSGLSSTEFEGFTKVRDNTYETTGFANAVNKMYIHMKGGVSDFKVSRY